MGRTSTRLGVLQIQTKRLVPGTSAADVIVSYPVIGDDAILDLGGYVYVSTSTTLTVSAAWTDPDGGSDSYSWYSAEAVTKGGKSLATQTVLAKAGTTATISVTSSVPSAVHASGFGREAIL